MSSMMPDWSLLPEELLHFISQNVENCFDGVHGRSVCTSWRSNIPFPSCLLRTSYSLPTFAQFPVETKAHAPSRRSLCAASTSPCEYFLGEMSQSILWSFHLPFSVQLEVHLA
uniref:F-box domain-containing protein n=1 Tax=Brassica campestris TaxID=3711 RepID=A0A3P6CYD8_BRACM|nr:unnamed protein product [Brassica rapa]